MKACAPGIIIASVRIRDLPSVMQCIRASLIGLNSDPLKRANRRAGTSITLSNPKLQMGLKGTERCTEIASHPVLGRNDQSIANRLFGKNLRIPVHAKSCILMHAIGQHLGAALGRKLGPAMTSPPRKLCNCTWIRLKNADSSADEKIHSSSTLKIQAGQVVMTLCLGCMEKVETGVAGVGWIVDRVVVKVGKTRHVYCVAMGVAGQQGK